MWVLNHKEICRLKNWCFWTVLEKTLESPLDIKEIKPVKSKGNQSLIVIEKIDAEAEVPIIWPLDAKNWLNEKTLMLVKTEGIRRRGYKGWDGWMASPTQWTWVRAYSRRCWGTRKPGMVQFMESQRVRQDLVTEQQQTIVLHIQLLSKSSMLKQMRWFFKYSAVFSESACTHKTKISIVIWTIVFCPWCFKSLDSSSVLINGFLHITHHIFKFSMKYSLIRLFIKRAFIAVFITRAKIWKQLNCPTMDVQRKHGLIYVYVYTNTWHTGILFKYKRELSCYLWLYGWMRRVLC